LGFGWLAAKPDLAPGQALRNEMRGVLKGFKERRRKAMKVQEATSITERQEGTYRSDANAASTHERLLVEEAKSGRSSAFGELYERHRLRIIRTAFRILRDRQDAEDATQRSFQHAFTNLGRFRGDSTFSTWITRIAINEALMMLRRKRSTTLFSQARNDEDQAPSALDLADERPTPEQALAETERRAAVLRAISHLRESLRIVVLLRELQGLTSAETARRLGLTVSAVKARTFHARRYLRQHLEREYKLRAVAFDWSAK
jgi:RNA polymerase sigma-70 factor (ECF subfamily)